jgi:serine/threonine protein kinase
MHFALFSLGFKRIWKIRFCFFLGALSYTAPEIFESGQYTIQSDIYSFGCILLDMITCDILTVSHSREKKFFVDISCFNRMKKHYNYVFVLDMMLIHCRKFFRIYNR